MTEQHGASPMSAEHSEHSPSHYVKIYAVLLALLVVSLLGPEIGIRSVTIVTAFGIAIVKALMVCAYFMHLNVEKRYIWYVLLSMVLFVGLFYFSVSPDVGKTEGRNWVKDSSLQLIEDNKDWHSQVHH